MSLRNTLTLVFVVMVLGMASTVQAQAKKLTRAELPAAVEKTVAEHSQGHKIQGFSTEVEGRGGKAEGCERIKALLAPGSRLRSEEARPIQEGEGKRIYKAELRYEAAYISKEYRIFQWYARVLKIDEQGTLLETRDQVPPDSVPPAVKAALTEAALTCVHELPPFGGFCGSPCKFSSVNVASVESITKNGKLILYEGHVFLEGSNDLNGKVQTGSYSLDKMQVGPIAPVHLILRDTPRPAGVTKDLDF